MKLISSIRLFFFLILGYFFINSCIFPYYVPIVSGKRQIDLSDVKPGVTTKEEVLLRFGVAFTTNQNETLFTGVYYLTKGHYGWMFGVPYGAGLLSTNSITSFYEVEIEFDDNDVVKRCEEFKLPREAQ
jgi:hypothetical protein